MCQRRGNGLVYGGDGGGVGCGKEAWDAVRKDGRWVEKK